MPASTITSAQAGQTTVSGEVVQPLAGVTIEDSNVGATDPDSSESVVDTFNNSGGPTVTITSPAEGSNVAKQTITGTAPVVDGSVTLTDNGKQLGTATIASNGTFTVTVTLPNQGSNSIVASTYDTEGEIFSSAAVVDTLDTIAPTATITSVAEASNMATQTITGKVSSSSPATVVGQTVTLTDNGKQLGTATVAANGTFTTTVTLPNQGSNSIVASVTDSYGNAGSSMAVVDTLDNVAPTVTITSVADASNVAKQTITGTAVSGGAATVAGQTVTLTDNGTQIGTATVASNGTFTATVALPNQGSNSLVASVTDSYGNAGSSAAVVDTLDNVAPTVTITSAAEASNVAGQTITGTAVSGGAATVAGQTVTLTDNGTQIGTATVAANGTFTATVTLPNQGANAIVASVTDSYGNAGSSAAVVDTLDTIAPTVTITSAAEASNVAGQTIIGTAVSGGAATVAGRTVTLTDNGTQIGTATVAANGTFTTTVTLPSQGANAIVASVTDSYGNVGSSAPLVDTLDSVAPSVTITSAAEASNVAAQTISGTVASGGTASVVGQTVALTDNGAALGTAQVAADGTFAANVTLPNWGANSIVATVTDSYGNTGGSAAVVDTLIGVPPTIAGTRGELMDASDSPILPFEGVTIGDLNGGAIDTLTIELIGPGGGLLSGVGLIGSGPDGILSGTASTITTELDNIVFTPPGVPPNGSIVTNFLLSDVSTAYPNPTIDNSTLVMTFRSCHSDRSDDGVAHRRGRGKQCRVANHRGGSRIRRCGQYPYGARQW